MVGWHACPDPTCRLEGLVEALDEIQEVSRVCYIEWNTIHAEHQEHLPVQHGLLLLWDLWVHVMSHICLLLLDGAARQPSGWSLGSNSAVYNLLLTLPSLDWGDLLAFLQAMLFQKLASRFNKLGTVLALKHSAIVFAICISIIEVCFSEPTPRPATTIDSGTLPRRSLLTL
jgi:hypothetical protein